MQAAGELKKADIFIDDTAGLNMFELRAKARRLQSKQALSLIIVDYLQLMSGDSRAENRQQEVSNISRSMKQLARELKVPVIAVSQLNRAPEARADRGPSSPTCASRGPSNKTPTWSCSSTKTPATLHPRAS